ncbi:polysaccharide pyruvyl transferase family protein [Pseudogracilibacillus sp. SO30301A]|uniref:polysaccharide pyruvyl transferase family protein n=1 Tax=Pseudogracilibacillus sp. SO30301A TaxID=3098291 RepID=UPI00300E46F7
MKNILIRSGISPLDTFDAAYMIDKNSIGGNVGNLIYAYSVYRTLMKEDTKIDPDYYSTDPNRADEINEKYDAYVIPLADAFRPDFIPLLRRYTKLIKKLKIPVFVIGVGLRAPFEPKLNEGFPFDKDVKAFVSAILEKSNMIGLWGEITSEYLTRLGFREGVDHTVIGSPSMYTFGRELKIRDTTLTNDSIVCVNSSMLSPKNVLDFISRSMVRFPNYYFIPQWLKEMKLVYSGSPLVSNEFVNYPTSNSHPAYMNNRVRFFLNAPTWIDFMKQADFSFGARLHGNVTATIAGTPSIVIPKDARMRELAEYHNLTRVWWNSITEETNIEDLIETADFHAPEKVQAKNFDHFIDFLNKNNIPHIYEENLNPDPAPLDKNITEITLKMPLQPIAGCKKEDIIERWNVTSSMYEEENKLLKKQLRNINEEKHKMEKKIRKEEEAKRIIIEKKFINQEKKLRNTLIKKETKIKQLENALNRTPVKLTLKAINKLKLK